MIRVGCGFDVHAFGEGRVLVLGGVTIPHDVGLQGHSDADVLTHAICDALLGAAGLPDIGVLFPDTDNAYKDINSLKLLQMTKQKISEAGGQLLNVDATLAMQAPKVAVHIPAIRNGLAEAMGCTIAQVNVKATTTERLGFVGRQEGVAAYAVTLLEITQ